MPDPTFTPEQCDALASLIQSVTDLWDEPLDDVRDIPQIVNAILASSWLADLLAAERAKVRDGIAEAIEAEAIRGWSVEEVESTSIFGALDRAAAIARDYDTTGGTDDH